ncbi:MAG TPA: long-chain-fatty-acid--CoA ligase [Bryobacteraceae bacterium]|jgi:fatty-acyl-CoA synthase|nr:long-chain-fatty-acid--CoA ligase [Bryobacteraceae bacterium]
MFVPLTPLRCLHRAMDLFGSKTGVVSGDRRFTYAEFGQRAERLASALPQFGIGAGDRVAYLSFNNHQLLEGYYGVVQARAIVMPLNVRLSEPELTAILCHSGAKMLLFENDFAPMAEKLRQSCRNVERWVTLDQKIPAADLTYEELLAAGHAGRADIFSYDESAVAELFYTSGSTGTPKGVTLAHRTLYLHALDVATLYKDVESAVDLHTIPLFHANGWGRPQASTMLGITQVMVRRFEPNFVFGLIQQHRATDMCLVPTMANALINAPDRGKFDLSSMRRVMIGGAASSPELVDRVEKAIPGCECMSGYGLTETSPVLTTSRPKGLHYASDAERLRRQAMAGWPVPGARIRVVDHEMKDVPRDMKSIGEVVAMGDHIMEGYYQEPEATAAVMTGPWFHTGDMAVWDEDGYIHIVDRKKEIIVSGGENISSLEVEREIFAHPAVLECAVVAAPSDQWGEVPAAIVVLKPGASLTQEELLAFLSARLGKFKLPRIVEFSKESLPKTGTGKIRKMVLKENFWAGKEKRVQG